MRSYESPNKLLNFDTKKIIFFADAKFLPFPYTVQEKNFARTYVGGGFEGRKMRE